MEYSIRETFTLPSKGAVYNPPIDPHITLRSMSTMDEMIRLTPSELPYKSLADLIDSCIEGDPGISAYDMCMGDFQFLLYKLRIVTYGADYKVQITCPYCGHKSEEVVDLEALELIHPDKKSLKKYSEFKLPVSKYQIGLNFETPRMIDIIAEQSRQDREDGSVQNKSFLYTLCQFIKTIDAHDSEPGVIEDWAKKLPMKDVNTIFAYADKLNALVGVQTKIPVTCDLCHVPYVSQIKATSEFFRPTLDI